MCCVQVLPPTSGIIKVLAPKGMACVIVAQLHKLVAAAARARW